MRRALRTLLAVTALVWGGCAGPPTGPARAEDEKPAKPETAEELKTRIVTALDLKTGPGLNDALRLVTLLGEQCREPAAREALGFDELQSRVVEARTTFFRKAVRPAVVKTMEKLIAAKVREKKQLPPAGAQPGAKPGPDPPPGTFAAAKKWGLGELAKQIWSGVQSDLGLTADGLDGFWKARTEKSALTASYGSGTSLVVKAAGRVAKSEEEWWDERSATDRARWLTTWFVESGGIFEVIRTDASELCGACGGRGEVVSNMADGTQSHALCAACNGAAKFRKVLYR